MTCAHIGTGDAVNVTTRHAIKRNRAAGLHYFDPETMEFFESIAHKGYNAADGSTFVVMSNRAGSADFLELCADVAVICGGDPTDQEQLALPAGGERYYYVIRVDQAGHTTNVSHPDGWRTDDHGWPDHTTADNYARALAAR